ncbi:MAG TPA: thioesterase family protein [Puia sp.]|nr:thioesterase family protein [Puia sp.]
MARIKIDLPDTFSFATTLAVRITDLNYGDHVGNDTVLSFIHEGRVRYLKSLGYAEFDMEGVGLIMADAALIFKNEMYYGDELIISIRAMEFSRVGFDLIYKIEKKPAGLPLTLVALAKTTMVCFNYELKKLVPLPENAQTKLTL